MKTNRENFYQFANLASLEDIKDAGFSLSHLLAETQKLNLLCEHEVTYFYDNGFHLKNEKEFLNDIQTRLSYHRKEEENIKNGKIKKGGFIKVANGSRVQGTVHVGGLQPDYIIDNKSREIKEFLYDVSSLKNMAHFSVWDKITETGNILRQKYIHKTEYDDEVYLELLKKYRDDKLEIPLSEYIKIKRGVCREVSLLTVLALEEIGIESYYYYAKVSTEFNSVVKEEDHAVVIANIDNELYVIDNYFKMFHAHRLEDLHNGVTCLSGTMYDLDSISGLAQIHISRLYPETRHNSRHI